MADNNQEFEAMVVPKGAKIVVGEKANIELDVQGDLILQESQKGLSSLISRHGSILIDENVAVNSSCIEAKHLIRVKGTLETNDIRSQTIIIDGGRVNCSEIQATALESNNGRLVSNKIQADKVSIKGGEVEIGTIKAKILQLSEKVKGSILISSAKERHVDSTVQIKGGFESDVELLGYLFKYRNQIMSDKVVAELKKKKEGKEFERFLLTIDEGKNVLDAETDPEEIRSEDLPDHEDAMETEIIMELSELDEDIAVDTGKSANEEEDIILDFNVAAENLESLLPEENERSSMITLIIASLKKGDKKTLSAIFSRWQDNLAGELEAFPEAVKEQIKEIGAFVHTN